MVKKKLGKEVHQNHATQQDMHVSSLGNACAGCCSIRKVIPFNNADLPEMRREDARRQ